MRLMSDSLKARTGSQAPGSATGPSAAVYQMPVHNSAALWANDLLAFWWLYQRARCRAASALHGWGTWALPRASWVRDVAAWGTYLPQSSRSHVSLMSEKSRVMSELFIPPLLWLMLY